MRSSNSMGNVKLLGLLNFFGDLRLFGPILITYFANVSGFYVLGGILLALKMISQAYRLPDGSSTESFRRERHPQNSCQMAGKC